MVNRRRSPKPNADGACDVERTWRTGIDGIGGGAWDGDRDGGRGIGACLGVGLGVGLGRERQRFRLVNHSTARRVR